MRQKLQDFITLLTKDRKVQVIAGVILLAALFAVFGSGNKHVPLPQRKTQKPGSGAMGTGEAYNDLVSRFTSDLETLKGQSHQTQVHLEQQTQQSKDYEQRTAEIFKRILERQAEYEARAVNASVNGGGPLPVDVGDEGRPLSDQPLEEDELEAIGFDEPIIAPPQPPPPQKVAVVGAGDSVRIKLLAGVNAPTDGTPYPVVFKLVSDVFGPDGSELPLGEARLVAAAQGSLTDSRALFRLSTLNVRLPDGRRKVMPVDGWVVGEDGKRGMEGVLIDPIGKAIIGAGITGGLDGFGRAVSNQQITRRSTFFGNEELITGDETKYAQGRALSGAAKEWSSLIRERANLMVPHVEVLSGREGTAVFSKSFLVKDLYEALAGDTNQFSSLD